MKALLREESAWRALTLDCLGKYFTEFSHQSTQRALQSWSKRARLLPVLVEDLDVIHVVLVFHACRIPRLESSTQILK